MTNKPLFLGLHGQPTLPTFIGFNGTGVDVSAAAGTVIGTLTTTGGLAPYTYTTDNTKFQIVGNQVQRSATGTLVQGVAESLNFTSTDAIPHSTNTATNGQGPYSLSVTAVNKPTGVTTNPTNISLLATTGPNTIIATLTETGGTGVNVVYSVTGNTNLVIIGNQLSTAASVSFTPGVNQTYSLHVTDTGGTYDDASPRTLTIQGASAPTGITINPVGSFPTVLANETAGTVLANLVEQGGTGVSTVFSLVAGSDTNLAISGSQLVIHSSPSFTPGTSPTYAIAVTDTGGTFSQTPNSQSYTVPAGPTNITASFSILDNATLANPSAGSATVTGGTPPYTFSKSGYNNFFDVTTPGTNTVLNLNSAGVGNLTPLIGSLAGTITAVDAAGLSTGAISLPVTIIDHTVSSQISGLTITAVNTSTTTDTAINANTTMFGHPLKSTDLASGTYPIFKMQDGTVIPYSVGQRRAWSANSSNKMAVYMLRLPEAIAHNVSGTGSNVMTVWTGGTAPAASALSTTDITTNTNFSMVATLLESVGTDTGTWTASLNTDISDALGNLNNATIETYCNGPAGIVYIICGNFKQSGVAHGQLRSTWYVQVLQGATSNLVGFRVLGKISQPFWDVDTPTKGFRVFSSIQFKSGSTVIRDMANAWTSAGNPFPFTWVSTNKFQISSGTTPIYGAESNGGYACRVSNSGGSLPTGGSPALAAGTTYYVMHSGSITNQFKLSTICGSGIGGSGPFITPTGAGSGTNTLTLYPALTSYNGIYTSGEPSIFDCFDSTGTAIADTPVRFQMNTAYWISTKCLLPYTVPTNSATGIAGQSKYVPNGAAGKAFGAGGNGPTQFNESTGDLADLGPLSLQYTRHLFTQSATDELIVRANGLTDVAFPSDLRTSTNGRIPAVNNGTNGSGAAYTGMSGPYPTMRNGATVSYPNSALPPSGTSIMTFFENSSDHMPDWSAYPYMFTGEPQFRDQMINKAANCVIVNAAGQAPDVASGYGIINNTSLGGPNLRNITIPGTTTYYGCVTVNNISSRAAAWGLRTVTYAAGLLADGLIEKTYFNDIMNDSISVMNDYGTLMATSQPFAGTLGLVNFKITSSSDSSFQVSYRNFAVAQAASLGESSAAITLGSYLAKYYAYVNTNFGGAFPLSFFSTTYRISAGGGAANITGATRANPCIITSPTQAFDNGDYIQITGVSGMTQLNGNTYILSNVGANSFQLNDTNGNPIDSTAYGTYVSGGLAGPLQIPDATWYGGQCGVKVTWTTGSPTFTVSSNGMSGSTGVNYVVSNGDKYTFPTADGSVAVPGGFSRFVPYYTINANATTNTCNLTSVLGDAGHIITPTDSNSASPFVVINSNIPTTKCYNNGDAGTFELIYGTMNALKAVGCTVDSTLLTNLATMFNAQVSGGKISPNTNSKYICNPNY